MAVDGESGFRVSDDEVKRRLADARSQKSAIVKDLQEAYFFTRPRLSNIVQSTSKPDRKGAEDIDDLATGIGQEVSQDFSTEMIAAFFPPHTKWAESSIADEIDDQDLLDEITAYDAAVFAQVRQSNFDAELSVALDPDAALGTVALWITAPGYGRSYRVEHVPIRELEINIGPYGEIDDRFRVRWVKSSKLRAVVGDVPLPEKVRRKVDGKNDGWIECVWGYWRDWENPSEDAYVHVLALDGEVVWDDLTTGDGSCPLVVATFSPDRLHAFGNGPAIAALQEFRILDVITAATEDRVDIAIAPPIGYPDDGVMDFEGGIEAGKAYPMRPGNGRDVVPLYFEGNPDLGFLTMDKIEKRIRRKFFADYPEQDGKTPPTATQWVDEMIRAQRRIGTPGLNFWRVGPRAVFQRFAWLAEKDGLVERPQLSGTALTLTPNNPATQAQDQQTVQTALRLLGVAKSYFPVTSQAAIDEMATIKGLQTLLKDKVIVFRDESEVRALVQQVIGQMSAAGGDQQPGGGDVAAQ